MSDYEIGGITKSDIKKLQALSLWIKGG